MIYPVRLSFSPGPEEEIVVESDLEGRFVVYPEDSLRFDANFQLGYFSSPSLTVQRTDLAFSYNGDEAVFRANVRVDQRRDAVIAGRADLIPGQEQIILEN